MLHCGPRQPCYILCQGSHSSCSIHKCRQPSYSLDLTYCTCWTLGSHVTCCNYCYMLDLGSQATCWTYVVMLHATCWTCRQPCYMLDLGSHATGWAQEVMLQAGRVGSHGTCWTCRQPWYMLRQSCYILDLDCHPRCCT